MGPKTLMGWVLTAVLLLLGSARQTARAQDAGSGRTTDAPPAPVAGADTTARHGSFTAALSAGNNLSFFGRSQTERYPYAATELTYKSRYGVWGSAVSYDIFGSGTVVDETDLSAGWDGDLSKKVDASASYSRFLFAANSPLIKSSVNNSLDAYLGWDWGYVYSRLNAAYVFGTSDDFFLILDNSRYFKINAVFTPDGYLTIEPRLSATAGTQAFAETSQVQQQQRGNIKPHPGNGNGGSGQAGTGRIPTVTTETTRFRLLNYELRVPVTYNLGKVAVQAAWRYTVPVSLLPDDVSEARSYFTASVSFNL